jgi:metal-responsive CopG/Arc/MetJ family transcriptional regulator
MKRRSKTKFTQIHVSIPLRLLEDFDDTLSYTQSRSKAISNLIRNYMTGDGDLVKDASTRTLMIHLKNQDDIDATLKALLLHILAK